MGAGGTQQRGGIATPAAVPMGQLSSPAAGQRSSPAPAAEPPPSAQQLLRRSVARPGSPARSAALQSPGGPRLGVQSAAATGSYVSKSARGTKRSDCCTLLYRLFAF